MKPRNIIATCLGVAAVASAGSAAAIVTARLLNKSSASADKPAAPEGDSETELLRAATDNLRKRNEQLTALYNVFSEITESLEIRYVINSTLRETLKIMKADMAVLRSLRGDQLVSVGAMASTGQELQNIRPVALGEGPTGRAAKRGRTIRMDEDGETTMAPVNVDGDRSGSPAAQTGRKPMESGLIAPLIIGARVVGTISCWSQKKSAFDPDDERIIEMMASQVATAMVAADAMANSERRALTDPLTELPNRLQLNDDLHGPLIELGTSGRPALIAMADIDHFKRFNDDYGHHIGDVALQKVASVLRTAVRDGDHVYRYGGEEFVFIFCDAEPEEAELLAERVRATVEATPLLDDDGEKIGPITISIGIAVLPDHATTIAALIELADVAMYKAKTTGRNRVVIWDEDIAAEKLAA
jgi:diguanylate cyclase (GGDEF)-like protein